MGIEDMFLTVKHAAKLYFNRRAYELATVTSHRRHTVLEPASTQMVSASDFEKLDIFRFFHYPCLGTTVGGGGMTDTTNILSNHLDTMDSSWGSHHPNSTMMANSDDTLNFVAPSPEADWLDFRPPYNFKSRRV